MTEREDFIKTVKEILKPLPPKTGRQSVDDTLPELEDYISKQEYVKKMTLDYFSSRLVPVLEQEEIINEVTEIIVRYRESITS